MSEGAPGLTLGSGDNVRRDRVQRGLEFGLGDRDLQHPEGKPKRRQDREHREREDRAAMRRHRVAHVV